MIVPAGVVKAPHVDPFAPVLYASQALELSAEQDELIQKVLKVASSDSAFATKSYEAIRRILTAGVSVVPTISSLSPDNAMTGTPVTLTVNGTNFTATSKINVNGNEQVTNFVSDTSLSTEMDLTGVAKGNYPVVVTDGDLISSPKMFKVNDGTKTTHSSEPSKAKKI